MTNGYEHSPDHSPSDALSVPQTQYATLRGLPGLAVDAIEADADCGEGRLSATIVWWQRRLAGESRREVQRGLQELLDFDGDIEETFAQTFQISYNDVFGSTITHELKADGGATPVTGDNRREFVDLYADFLLNSSVEKQFKAFYRGFLMVTDESPLGMLFLPHEIELLVCGSKVSEIIPIGLFG